jgi:glycosyltransferase involved in cell wall biosynthesis
MKESKLISIMMPVYNGLPDIERSVESLYNQSYKKWECIIIDDGSNDGTSEYIDSLSDPRFIVYHFKKNLGRPYARQKALDLAKGEFLAMLDAGDIYHSDKLSIQINEMDKNPEVSLVSSGMCSFGYKSEIVRVRGKGSGKIKIYDKTIKGITHASSLLRMKRAKDFKYNMNLQLGQDTDFINRYMEDQKYIVLPNILYYYSEFDSVTLNKIQKTYKLNLLNSYRENELKSLLKNTFKYLVSLLVYPFLKIEFILKKRGEKLTDEEYLEYVKNVINE